MVKIVLFFFSGTGNTWWVSQQLVDKLAVHQAQAEAVSIERTEPKQADGLIAAADIVGFGYPIYGSDLPQIMKDFIAQLRPVQAKPAFVFCTQWLWSGDGARVGASFLHPKGFSVRQGAHFLMPNNVCVPIAPLPFTNDKDRMQGQLRRADRKLDRFVSAVVSGNCMQTGFNRFAQFCGAIQRVPFRKGFSAMQDSIGFDHLRCTRCQLCAQYCPVGNIRLRDGMPTACGKCILCLRCYNFCPVSAVTFRGRAHNFKRGEPFRGPVEGFRLQTIAAGHPARVFFGVSREES